MGGTDQDVLNHLASLWLPFANLERNSSIYEPRIFRIVDFVIKARNLPGLLNHATNSNDFFDNRLLSCHFLFTLLSLCTLKNKDKLFL